METGSQSFSTTGARGGRKLSSVEQMTGKNTITAETEEAEIIKENLSLRLSYLAK